MDALTKKTIAVMSVFLMLATPLGVIDMGSFSTNVFGAPATDVNSDEEYIGWTPVSNQSELETALAKGGNIKLKESFTVTKSLESPKQILLNLNKKTITFNLSSASDFALNVSSDATIEFGTITVGNGNGILVTNSAEVELSSLTVSGAIKAIEVDGGKLTVSSGSYAGTSSAISVTGDNATVDIMYGTFSSNDKTIDVSDAETGKSHKITIHDGTFKSATGKYSLHSDDASTDSCIQINLGTFDKAVLSKTPTKIYGGIFSINLLGTAGYDNFTVYGGTFADDVTDKLGEDCGIKSVSEKYVAYQKNAFQLNDGNKYDSLSAAFADAQTGDTINIVKPGVYALDVYNKDVKIKGISKDVILDCRCSLYNGTNAVICLDLSNLTVWSLESPYIGGSCDVYLGFIGFHDLRLDDVTLYGARAFYSTETTHITNCTFIHHSNNYAMQIYDSSEEFVIDGCTFDSFGKAALLFRDNILGEPTVTFRNTTFNDDGLMRDCAAIEIHTEYNGAINQQKWIVNIEGCEAYGFYKYSQCGNNLWNAINNNCTEVLSTKGFVYVDGDKVNPAPFDAKLYKQNGEEWELWKTISGQEMGKIITEEVLDYSDIETPELKCVGFFNKEGSTMYFDVDGNAVHKYDVNKDLRLYPKFASKQQHTVTYDTNGGGAAPASEYFLEYEAHTIAGSARLQKTGYEFQGWSDGYKTYKAGESYYLGSADITLKAVWSKTSAPSIDTVEVTIKVTDKDGNVVQGADVYVDSVYLDTTNVYGEVTGEYTKTSHSIVAKLVSENAVVTAMANFATSDEITVAFNDYSVRTVVEQSLASDANVSVSDKINTLAEEIKESENASNVELKIVVNNSAERAAELKEELDEMKALSKESECLFFDVEVFLNLDGNVSQITDLDGYTNKVMEFCIPFDPTGKKSITVYHCHEGDYIEIKEGTGAMKGTDGTYYIDENNIMHIFTSKFSAFTISSTEDGTYKLRYDVDGGSVEMSDVTNISGGTQFTVPEYSGVKEDYEFRGWSDGTNTYQPGQKITVNSDVTLKAVWKQGGDEPVEKDKVSFIAFFLAIFILAELIGLVYIVSGKK